MAKQVWMITATIGLGGSIDRKRLTYKSKDTFDMALRAACTKEGNGPHILSDDYGNSLVYYADKIVDFFAAEVWQSAEGDMVATREIQLASAEAEKGIKMRGNLLTGAEAGKA